MEINPNANITCLSTSLCQEQVQSEVQVTLLKEAMDFAKDITSKLLQSVGVGQNIDIVA